MTFSKSQTKEFIMKRFIALLLCVFSVFAVSSCCDDDLPPDAVGIFVHLVNKENGSIDKTEDLIYDNINVCLRNDDISDKIIKEKSTGKYSQINFYFCTESFKDDTLVSEEEYDNIYYSRTKYYLVVNDPDGSSYNPKYETRKLSFNNGERRMVVAYLPEKS